MSQGRVPTYWDYLRLSDLLNLQSGLDSDESDLLPDELHFILVHQTMELWFKLILSQLRLARDHLVAPDVPEEHIPHVVHHLGRVIEILKLSVPHFDVVETLTPRDFLAFRDKLFPASGFQSFQLRELEILLGMNDADREMLGSQSTMSYIEGLAKDSPAGSLAWGRILKASAERTLKESLETWLYRTPIQGSTPDMEGDAAVIESFLADYLGAWEQEAQGQLERLAASGAAEVKGVERRFKMALEGVARFLRAEDVDEGDRVRIKRVRAALVFVESYRELPLLAWPRRLLDSVAELEERLILFRHRHVRMVERLIGRRVGTGGSAGVDYLDKTTRYRVFQDLWTVRTVLLRRDALPDLLGAEAYGFAR